MFPLLLLVSRWVSGRLAGLTREQMDGNADIGNAMTERFNVGGAMLLKLFGRRGEEDALFATKAATVRDLGIRISLITRIFAASMMMVPALATALVYGVGGHLAIERRADRRHPDRARHAAAAPARPAAGPLQRPHRRDDRAGQLRAGLRGARPAVADPGEAGRRRRCRPAPRGSSSTTSRSATRAPTRSRWPRSRSVARKESRDTRPGAHRHRVRRRARPDGRAGRPVRRRQDHDHPPGRAALRRRRPARSGSAATTSAT